MTPDWVATGATLFTAIVIAASAVAALMQLRHMRKSNEIEIIDKWTRAIEDEKFERARWFVTRELPKLLADAQRVRALSWNPLPPELAPIRVICNHFESVGSFVKLGSVDARVACELWSYVVLDCWRAIAPVTALVRRRSGKEGVWENFEYLAVLAERHLSAHPVGTYPSGTPRMPVDDSLLTALDTAADDG
ncbi:MAG TPA: hypothetical protein VFN37_12150 [Candidatus Baltobacteraceae bacterium]|nr:hypothetical protein [Candidatus Baltobacteraceae bacterium]